MNVFLVLGALLALPLQHALASNEVFDSISIGGVVVRESETVSLSLHSTRFVRNLVIQAQGYSRDSMVEVMVNGEVKGTIFAPGRDPSYVVTIGETTHSIEFRHRSGGAMQVLQVVATVSRWAREPRNPSDFFGTPAELRQLALLTMQQISALTPLVSLEDETTYLFPIKKKAGLVYVMSSAHGNISKSTLLQVVAMTDQIDFADSLLQRLMRNDNAFDAVVRLLTVRERIRDLLD